MPDKKTVIVHSAKKALGDLDKKYKQFQEWQAGVDRQAMKKLLASQQPQISPTLESQLIQSGLPASFSVRSGLAKQFGIDNYTATPEQDNIIMMGLAGKTEQEMAKNQQMTEKSRADLEMAHKDREFSLKERELELKKEQAQASKAPSADEIAQSIISKYQNQ